MIFRQSKHEEVDELFKEAYKVWSKNRTFQQYCIDNSKEDAYGTRYVIEDMKEIVSSLILLNLDSIKGRKVYGIGSVLTSPKHKGKGYATELLKRTISTVNDGVAVIFLYSELEPSFYERFHFRVLPRNLQKDKESICMVLCDDMMWKELQSSSIEQIPDHF
jgi:RimJ/RimL family protein N-acetyltransferase